MSQPPKTKWHQVPELCREIMLILMDPFLPLPKEDDLINHLKMSTDDCELAAEMRRTRARLRGVCKVWKDALPDIFIILPESTRQVPTAKRVQFPCSCECQNQRCQMKTPPKITNYEYPCGPMEALIDSSIWSQRDILSIIEDHPGLKLLAISVDFTSSEKPFSLPKLSKACSGLTHLSLSQFSLPFSLDDQTLNLPFLNTLTLNFDCPISSDVARVLHPSFDDWNLPRLRYLSLRGWVSDSDEAFFSSIHNMLRRVGETLRGLLYNIWYLSSEGEAIHPLPPSFWQWCPHLHTIQTSPRVLFSGPKPGPTHPRLTVVPVHLGKLEELGTAPKMANQIWPRKLLEVDLEEWRVERFRISTTWSTFHQKLRANYNRKESNDAQYWPIYFSRWTTHLLTKKYSVEDRYGVAINSTDRAAQGVLSWLQNFDDWVILDASGKW